MTKYLIGELKFVSELISQATSVVLHGDRLGCFEASRYTFSCNDRASPNDTAWTSWPLECLKEKLAQSWCDISPLDKQPKIRKRLPLTSLHLFRGGVEPQAQFQIHKRTVDMDWERNILVVFSSVKVFGWPCQTWLAIRQTLASVEKIRHRNGL